MVIGANNAHKEDPAVSPVGGIMWIARLTANCHDQPKVMACCLQLASNRRQTWVNIQPKSAGILGIHAYVHANPHSLPTTLYYPLPN